MIKDILNEGKGVSYDEFEKIYNDFSKAFGKLRDAVGAKDKKAVGYINKLWQDIDNVIDPVYPPEGEN